MYFSQGKRTMDPAVGSPRPRQDLNTRLDTIHAFVRQMLQQWSYEDK